MRIALDVMGGDKAPEAIVEGAIEAIQAYERDLQKLYLVGDEETVKRELDRRSYAHGKIEIVHASEIVTMHDSAVKSVRQKKDSSISVAADLVKRGDAEAVVSAGNTGAAVAAATIKWRHIPGVERSG
ncbi:MAG TPA: phosphate acyltransferase, partial [Bacteroidia bacterium]|nr:phosphate acyltransferase [Bacteroidia bacterium]